MVQPTSHRSSVLPFPLQSLARFGLAWFIALMSLVGGLSASEAAPSLGVGAPHVGVWVDEAVSGPLSAPADRAAILVTDVLEVEGDRSDIPDTDTPPVHRPLNAVLLPEHFDVWAPLASEQHVPHALLRPPRR